MKERHRRRKAWKEVVVKVMEGPGKDSVGEWRGRLACGKGIEGRLEDMGKGFDGGIRRGEFGRVHG